MVMRAQDVGSQLTRVEQADGAWSLPAARLAADSHEWRLWYEREVARAEAAEARADEWRQAQIVVRSQVCSLKALFEANRNKLIEARQETEAIRRTAKDALSLQAEVQRLTKLLAATHVEPRKRCTMVSLRMQVGDLREENARLRSQLRKALRRSRRPQGTPKTLSRANARLRKSLQVSQKRTAALETALAEVGASRAVLSKSLYGRRSEQQAKPHSTRRRGQQPGVRGHGRKPRPALEERLEVHSPPAEACVCGGCGTPYVTNGERSTTIIEIDVQAHKRRILRPRWRRACDCADSPREVAAPAPHRLFAHTPYGTTVWARVLFERYVCHRPLNRVARWLGQQGLPMAAGTLGNSVSRFVPLFESLGQAILDHQHQAAIRHGDETSWRIQSLKQAGRSARAWLWTSVTVDAAYFHIDPSRSAAAAAKLFGETAPDTVLVCDRYSAYKKLARELAGSVVLAWCWSHQRRDFIDCAAGQVALAQWCETWLGDIAGIYRLNKKRLSHYKPGLEQQDEAFEAAQRALETEIERLFATATQQLAARHKTAREAKPLRSLLNHREGLSVFLQRPAVPMDNNFAERTLRGAVIGRRLSFGSDSETGAQLTALMYSVVETLALNDIDVHRWLQEWLKAGAANGGRAPPDLAEWLPWSMSQTQRRALMAPA